MHPATLDLDLTACIFVDLSFSLGHAEAQNGAMIDPDQVADLVLKAYDALPPKFKPREREEGKQEWVPLSGIVLSQSKI